jgi:hypothetical protein
LSQAVWLPAQLGPELFEKEGDRHVETKRIQLAIKVIPYAVCLALLGLFCSPWAVGQDDAPQYKIDPYWPKPLPNHWVLGGVGGICMDHDGNIFALNRSEYNENDLEAGERAPLVLEFNSAGDLLNSWGNPAEMPKGEFHGCVIDKEDHLWLISENAGAIQEYTEAGKLLLQIGKLDVFDSSTGAFKGKALNSGHNLFFGLQGIALDKDDNIYIAEGFNPSTNHRVVVLDHDGRFLRQWEIQRTPDEPSNWVPMPDCVRVDRDNNVYVGDRLGNRFLIYDTMGNFKKFVSIPMIQRTPTTQRDLFGPIKPIEFAGFAAGHWGSVIDILFSTDPGQKYLIDLNEDNEEVMFLNRATLNVVTTFGRVGAQVGEFNHVHYAQMDSKGNLYIGEVDGNRLDKYVPVNDSW